MKLSRPSSRAWRVGSSAKTSEAAPAIVPASSASARSSSSTMPPRAVLIRSAVGFIRESCGRRIMERVAGVSGTWSETTSLSARRRSSEACSMRCAAQYAPRSRRSCARIEQPTAARTRAVALPTWPRPIRPTRLPSTCTPPSRTHRPCFRWWVPSAIRRASAIMSPSVSSATAGALTPGDDSTAIPRRAQPARSTLSRPTPNFEITRSAGQASSRAASIRSRPMIAAVPPCRNSASSAPARMRPVGLK
jgi:hypothetical protein